MKKSLLLLLAATAQMAYGQYYYTTNSGQTPGNLNTDDAYPAGSGQASGWTSLLGPSVGTPTWSADQNIPFAFNFNGSAVTSYKVSSTGVLTFTTSAGTVPGATPAALPSASIPDNSICAWGLEASGTNDNVSIKTFGSSPNRQHWIHFSSCTNGSISWSYWSIVLEEGSDKIYIVDQRNTSGTGALSLGVQINSSEAYSVAGSPSVGAQAGADATSVDDYYYEFIYGTQAAVDVELLSFDILPYIGQGNTDIMGTVKNNGSQTITSMDVTWNDGSGAQVDNMTGLNIQPNATYQFSHGTPLNAVAGQAYTIDLSIDVTGDATTNNNDAQESTVSLTQIPTKYVVGEEKTGTWCGWCPRGGVALAEMEAESHFIGIAVHNGDPMTVTSYDGAIGTYVPGGYPGGGVDRVIDGDPSDFQTMFNERSQDVVPCSVNQIDANFNQATGEISVSTDVEFYGNIAGNYRLSLVLVEDDVIGSGGSWDQSNYYDGGGAGTLTDPNTGFEWSTAGSPVNPADFGGYDHVARYLSSNDILGDANSLPSGTVTMGTHSHNFSTVPSGTVDDPNKTHAVVMVVNATTGEILNAGKSGITTTAVTEVNDEFEFNAYPNPATDIITFSYNLKSSDRVAIQLVDALGSEVTYINSSSMMEGTNIEQIDCSQLPSGIYFANLIVGDQKTTKRISIIK